MLEKTDKIVLDLINAEKSRQEEEIELIASENYASYSVLEAVWSELTNKYSEWYAWKRYYAWNHIIDKVENLAIERAKKIFWAEYVNVQPLSGSPANIAVFLWLLEPWDTILSLSLDQGWHLTHWHNLNFSGKLYNIVYYNVDKDSHVINMEDVLEKAKAHSPKLIIAWFSAYPRKIEWSKFREIADETWAILMWDISHTAGLIAWWVLENPIPYCDVVTTTTHKTLRWPRWAMIMSKEKYAKALARAVFPWIQWWPHDNLTAWKAVAFWEALDDSFKDYARQVVDNAQALSTELSTLGFDIISWWTDTHLILIDVFWSKWVTWQQAEEVLEFVWLSTNKNMVPYDIRKPLDPSWIRIWTPAVTTRWMKEDEMKLIARIFSEAIDNIWNEEKLNSLRKEILDLCKNFPVYS